MHLGEECVGESDGMRGQSECFGMTGRSEGDNEGRRRKRRRGGRREEQLSGSRQKLCLKCQFKTHFARVCVCFLVGALIQAALDDIREISAGIPGYTEEKKKIQNAINMRIYSLQVSACGGKEDIGNHCVVSLCVFDTKAGTVL